MSFSKALLTGSLCFLAIVSLTRCGIASYPGQPTLVTNSYAKIDLEYLEDVGLFVYEVVYDNRSGSSNVGAIVTKLYPAAKTFTSNVRTNSEGTLFRAKQAYDGAEVQMIALPGMGQINFSPDHKIQFLLEYATSLDEVDDRNVAEQGLFKPAAKAVPLSQQAVQWLRWKWELLRAGKFNSRGGLSYQIEEVELGTVKYKPSAEVIFETNVQQNGVRSALTTETKKEFTAFLETNFPTGFKGVAKIHLKNVAQPLSLSVGISTPKTLAAKGWKVSYNLTEKMAQEILRGAR